MYLNQTDVETGLYPEILNVLTRNPDNVETAIKEAEAEVAAYLRARYDIDSEYAKSGAARNTMCVKLVRELAIYNAFKMSNPVNMSESRVQAYKDTINFLKDCQSEKASIPGLSRLTDANNVSGSSYLISGGNSKRNNSY
jgi:phage gp36-like protein